MKKVYLLVIICISFFTFSACGRVYPDVNFYFVQITDTHLGCKDNLERTEKIIEKINALPFKVEFVVHTGDIFNDNIEDANAVDAAKGLFSKLKVPIHFIAGNHDISAEKAKSTYVKNFGRLDYVEENNNIFCIFACVEPLLDDSNSNDADFFKWFESALQKAENKPVFVFSHEPAGLDYYDNSFHHPWPIETEKRWVELVNSYHVKAVITGHFHRDEFHWLGNVPLFVCEPVSNWLGRQAAFRVYQYKNGRLDYFTQYIDTY
jgi:3',5'-cyclic AMP phosphodiesterase CpdA